MTDQLPPQGPPLQVDPSLPPPRQAAPTWVLPVAIGGGVVALLAVAAIVGPAFMYAMSPNPDAPTTSEVRPHKPSDKKHSESDAGSKSGSGGFQSDKKSGQSITPAPDSPSGSGGDAGVASSTAGQVVAIAEKYSAAQKDGTIYSLLPGGDQVDPSYVGAFLYVLTDVKSATRFGGSEADMQELLDKAQALEKKFLAGEDLEVSVRIKRQDGSVFESDGVYRLVQ